MLGLRALPLFNKISRRLAATIVACLVLVSLFGCALPGGETTLGSTIEPTRTPSPGAISIPPEVSVRTILDTEPPPAEPSLEPAVTSTAGVDYFTLAYPLNQIGYKIPLTVRHVSPTTATFFFELDGTVEGRLVYRSDDPSFDHQGEISFTAESPRHTLTLEDLSPGVRYQARVLIGSDDQGAQQPGFGGSLWDPLSFKTSSGGYPLRFGVLGDASFGDDATRQLVNLISGYDLDFLIHTGDVVYEVDTSDPLRAYVTKFFEPFAPLLKRGPVYTVPGNHDYDAVLRLDEGPVYDQVFPPFPDPNFVYPETRRANQFYAFSYADVQFLMLDSQAIYGAGGRQEQDAWMKDRLADPAFRLTIPVFHVAPYSSSSVHPGDSLPIRSSWAYLFESAAVPLSLSGHFHHYERLIANGITYLVSGGGSSVLYVQGAALPESQFYAARTHFVLVEIFPEYIQLSAISKEGETFDQATIYLK